MEIFELLLHQKAHRALLNEHGNADSRGVGAMRCAESIIDINIAEFCERTGEFWIVRFLPWLKA